MLKFGELGLDGSVEVSVSVIVRVIQLLGSDQGKGKCMVRPLGKIRVGVVDQPNNLLTPTANLTLNTNPAI